MQWNYLAIHFLTEKGENGHVLFDCTYFDVYKF